jgi:hypothetical protein
MQHLSPAAECVRAQQKFTEESAAMFVVVAGEGNVKRKIAQGNRGDDVTSPKGVHCPTKPEDSAGIDGNLVVRRFVCIHWCNSIKVSKMDENINQVI